MIEAWKYPDFVHLGVKKTRDPVLKEKQDVQYDTAFAARGAIILERDYAGLEPEQKKIMSVVFDSLNIKFTGGNVRTADRKKSAIETIAERRGMPEATVRHYIKVRQYEEPMIGMVKDFIDKVNEETTKPTGQYTLDESSQVTQAFKDNKDINEIAAAFGLHTDSLKRFKNDLIKKGIIRDDVKHKKGS